MKATLDFKIRSNAVKQELEKNQELVRATIRCIVSLADLSETGKKNRGKQMLILCLRLSPPILPLPNREQCDV